MKRAIINKIIILTTVFIFSIMSINAATLTCQQVTDTSLDMVQFSSTSVEIRCTASGGTVGSIQITPNSDPSSGLTITNSQAISSSITSGQSSTAKYTITGDSPNLYEISYTISNDGTLSWTGSKKTAVDVVSAVKLTVEYVLPPSFFIPTVAELDVKITNIGGTTANNVKLQLNNGTFYSYPTTIAAGASSSYTWTNSTGFNTSGTQETKVYIGDTLHDTVSATVAASGSGSTNLSQETGWNLISLPKVPSNTSPEAILSDIMGTVDVLWGMESGTWKKYDPDGTQTLTSMNILYGYWLKRTNTTNLEISGDAHEGGTLSMTTGWNLVGYPATNDNLNVNLTVQSIISDIDIIWGYDGSTWLKYNPASYNPLSSAHLHTFKHGRGYWYKVTSDVDLVLS